MRTRSSWLVRRLWTSMARCLAPAQSSAPETLTDATIRPSPRFLTSLVPDAATERRNSPKYGRRSSSAASRSRRTAASVGPTLPGVRVYELRDIPGGKARSIPVRGSGVGGRADLPGEHGFRFFPGFYQHVPDTMRRIPNRGRPGSVFDHLVPTTRAAFVREGQLPIV